MAHLATVIVAALTLPLVVSYLLNETARRYQDQGLLRQAHAIDQGLTRQGGWHVELGKTLSQLYATGYDGRAYAVLDRTGRVVTASLRPSLPAIRSAPREAAASFFNVGSIQGLSMPVGRGADLWVVVSQDLNNPEVVTDDIVTSFLYRFLIWLAPILLALPLINAILIRRSTQAVLAVSRHAAEVRPDRLDIRLSTARLPTEVTPLADATNLAFDRLEAGFRTQSEFVANVAHELRTPLSLLRLQVDGLEGPHRKSAMQATIDRASHVVSQLLDLASLEQIAVGSSEYFDLDALVRDALEAMAPAVLGGNRTIGLSGDDHGVPAIGRAPLIHLALVNLIDNSIRHTPPGTHIEVSMGPGLIIVEDNGPGIATADLAQVSKRFWTAGRARSDNAGIGLSIVERIVSSHGGQLRAASRSGGGASFTIELRTANGIELAATPVAR